MFQEHSLLYSERAPFNCSKSSIKWLPQIWPTFNNYLTLNTSLSPSIDSVKKVLAELLSPKTLTGFISQ